MKHVNELEAVKKILELVRSGPASRWQLYRRGPLSHYNPLKRCLSNMLDFGLIEERSRKVSNGMDAFDYAITEKGFTLLELLES